MNEIPFNQPYLTGKEAHYFYQAVYSKKISGNGQFTQKCQHLLEEKYHFNRVFLTSSCTDALEMTALLLDIKPGDEVILPSFTFVSTANAFVLRGAKMIFADSSSQNPNLDVDSIKPLITTRTRAIVLVHYAGIACDMDPIMELARQHEISVVEDAAHSIDSFYKGRPLGGIGDFGTLSFHETKNIISGEGGGLIVNNPEHSERAEIIWEKGTNRASFWRGEVDKYGWVDVGSSFLPSEIIAAFLFAQLEEVDGIQQMRKNVWDGYFENLKELGSMGEIKLPDIPEYAFNNAHMFYMVCPGLEVRSKLIENLKKAGVNAVFHYLPLHKSPYFEAQHDGRELPNSDYYSDCLLRLPFYNELQPDEVDRVSSLIRTFFK